MSPFSGDDENSLYNSIQYDRVIYLNMTSVQKDFCTQVNIWLQFKFYTQFKLFERLPRKRLGVKGGDVPQAARQLKNHAFFRDINFEQMDKKGVKPPFVPVSFRIFEHSINFKSLNQKPTSTKSSPACRQNSQSLTVATLTTWTRKCSRPLRASTRAPTKLSASSINVASVRVCVHIYSSFFFVLLFALNSRQTKIQTKK